MIIMLDADKTIIKTKDMIAAAHPFEQVQRTVRGNYTLASTKKPLTEKDNKRITRLSFIGHSGYEEGTGIQCYGGYEVEDFSNLLIERLKEADKASGNKAGFTSNLTSIDLVGCFTGYISPEGESFAGRVAQRLLKAGFDIRINAFTNQNLAQPHAIASMITMPSPSEGKFYIWGFTTPENEERYEEMRDIFISQVEKKENKACELAEVKEKILAKGAKYQEVKKQYSEIMSTAKQQQTLKTEIKELEDKIKSQQIKKFSPSDLNKAIAKVVNQAKQANSKWKTNAESLLKEIQAINASQGSEEEKINRSMKEIDKTVKEIRSHFTGKRSSTANLFQDVIDNKDNLNSFSSLKTLLATINKDAIHKKSKWQKNSSQLLLQITQIDQSTRSEEEKLKESFALIKHAAKDIREHFFGGKGSTTATRLEKILEKHNHYLTHANEQNELSKTLDKKKEDLRKLHTNFNKTREMLPILKENRKKLATELKKLKQDEKTIQQQVEALDKQLDVTKKKLESFTVKIATADNIRNYLDSHSECNFTQHVKDKQLKRNPTIQSTQKLRFFQTPINTSTTPSLPASKRPSK